MADDLLPSLEHREQLPQHKAHHNIESFVWVFVYSLLLPKYKQHCEAQQEAGYNDRYRLNSVTRPLVCCSGLSLLTLAWANIMFRRKCLPDNALGDCAKDLLRKVYQHIVMVRDNADETERADRYKREANRNIITPVLAFDHDFVLGIVEKHLPNSMVDENAPA